MCELFAVSSRMRTGVSLSIRRLANRGSPGGKLADGWGVACYDGFDARVLREPEPAADSAWLEHVIASGRPNSQIVIAHIRHATRGGITPRTGRKGACLRAQRHADGRRGNDRRLLPRVPSSGRNRLRGRLLRIDWRDWRFYGTMTSRPQRPAVRLLRDMRRNCASLAPPISSIRTASCSSRTVLERRCAAERDALPAAGVELKTEAGPQTLTLFASVPLTDEDWRPLQEIVVAFNGGLL